MNDVTEEQRAAVEWLQHCAGISSKAPAHAHARVLLATLPDALTNPQPVLPTVPGVYVDDEGNLWRRYESGEWQTLQGVRSEQPRFLPLTRLVPERPQVTREQIVGLLNELSAYSAGYKADALLGLLNDTRA